METKKNIVLILKLLSFEKKASFALNSFYIEIFSGEIVNLIGPEGSGKEEIYSLLFGELSSPDCEVWFMNKRYTSLKKLPVERSGGIYFIDNRESVVPALSVAENIYILDHISYLKLSVPKKKMENQALQLFQKFSIEINPAEYGRNLNDFEKYLVRLMRAYVKRARLLVINDILTDYSYGNSALLIEILNKFKAEGMSVLWLNSFPDTISDIADRISVIKDGKNISTIYHTDYCSYRVMSLLEANNNFQPYLIKKNRDSSCVFELSNITNQYFSCLNLSFYKGEITGIFDIYNKFSRELRRLLLGKREFTGQVWHNGCICFLKNDATLIRNKIGLIDGRKYDSMIFPTMSLQENLSIVLQKKMAVSKLFVNPRVEKYLAKELKVSSSPVLQSSRLQDVSHRAAMDIVYKRMLLLKPDIVFCFEPFFHLDVFSRQRVVDYINSLSVAGTSVVLTGVSLSLFTASCDRILFVKNNQVVQDIRRENFGTDLK